MKWKAREAAAIVGGRLATGDPGRVATGICTDTRKLRDGQAFVALKGERFDGNTYVLEAARKGASWIVAAPGRPPESLPSGAAVIEVPDTLAALGALAADYRRRFKVKIAAVTGSVGKSTTKEMIAAALSVKGRVLKNEGNFNNLIGLPLTLFRLTSATDAAVLEMGCNRPGEIASLTEIARPHAGLITKVAPVHLEGLGSIEGVADAKAELIRGLPAGAAFILNLDDPLIVSRARGFKGRTIGFSTSAAKKFRGESLHLIEVEKNVSGGRPRLRFWIQRRRDGKAVERPVSFFIWAMSPHDAVNALAAAAMGRALGVSLEEAAEKIRSVKGLPGRSEAKKTDRGLIVINDSYNASPAAVADALETMAWWRGAMRGVAVLGEMMELGPDADKYHREVGAKVAATGASLLVARGPHARVMAQAAIRAGLPREAAFVAEDNDEAIALLGKVLKKGDWVLIKGSRAMGMETVAAALAG